MKRVIILILLLCWTGCAAVAPIIAAARETGLTESSRRDLLAKSLKDYYRLIQFNRVNQALEHVGPEQRRDVQQALAQRMQGSKITNITYEQIEYLDDSVKARVTASFEMFRIPVYVVEQYQFVDEWQYERLSGWRLVSTHEHEVG